MEVENITYVRLTQAEHIELLKQSACALLPMQIVKNARPDQVEVTLSTSGIAFRFARPAVADEKIAPASPPGAD
jgi:hypothetical protein